MVIALRRQHAAFAMIIAGSLLMPLSALALTSETFELSPSGDITSVAPCPSGEVAITEETRPIARAAGLPNSVNCWVPSNPDIGSAVGTAKIYLRSILCTPDNDNFGGAGPDGTIRQLNGKFAICAAKFLQAANEQISGQIALYGGGTKSVCVREGYRTKEKQMEYYNRFVSSGVPSCDPRVKACEHTTGGAIDVNTIPDSNYPKLWSLGSQMGVTFYLGASDKYHFKPVNAGCLSTGGLGAPLPPGTPLPPSTYDYPQYAPNANPFQNPLNNPSMAFIPQQMLQQLAQGLAGQMQQQIQPAPVIAPTPQIVTPVTQPIPTTVTPTPSTSTIPVVVIPKTPTGTIAITPTDRLNPITPVTPPTVNPVPTENAGLSPLEIIMQIANIPQTPVGESVSLMDPKSPKLNADLNSGTTLTPGDDPLPRAVRATSTVVITTFISTDMSAGYISPPTTSYTTVDTQTPRILATLTQLRQGLERFLASSPRTQQTIAVWRPVPAFDGH